MTKLDTTYWAIAGNTGSYTWTVTNETLLVTDTVHTPDGTEVHNGLEHTEPDHIYNYTEVAKTGTVTFPNLMLKDAEVTDYFCDLLNDSFPSHSFTVFVATSDLDSTTGDITVDLDFSAYCTFTNTSYYYPEFEEAEVEQTVSVRYEYLLQKVSD